MTDTNLLNERRPGDHGHASASMACAVPAEHDDEYASAEPDESDDPTVPERFAVADAGSANWVVRKIIEARKYRDRVQAWAERETRRAEREEAFFLLRFGPQLESWARHEIAQAGGRRKSVSLPAGVVGFRTHAAKTVVEDEAAVLAWARVHCPDAVATIEKLSKAALNAHVQSTGEVPEIGLRLESVRECFLIR